ncbi:hypothetical protein Salat_1240600 [Sesamum alatum]|uniref:Uncharacterized protein n=1 Tax=Sesamum alatum TaxID=300844 RepID=A0AAE1YG57_9LAMI|nr:hypothetical protein Salat_1240600 [Sesamum alatum]
MVMEAVLLHGSLDQSISPYKSHIRTATKIQYPLMSRPSGTFLAASDFQAGMALLQAPPPPFLSRSYPPYSLQQPPQPPLLPLPTAARTLGRGLSCPPANKKPNSGNRTRDPSLTPKKSKSPTKNTKKEDKNSPRKSSDCVNVVASTTTTPSGPDPRELAKDVRKVLPLISSSGNMSASKNGSNCISNANSLIISSAKGVEDQGDMFSGSVVFTVSPPPSSLPLPTFSLRPKLSCKAEVAGIDTGATDNLRRLLRIQ